MSRASLLCVVLVPLLMATLDLATARAQPAPPRLHFVRGSVAVTVFTETQRNRDILLPHASVFLVRQNAPSSIVTSTITDLSGRFILATQEVGIFMLCIEAPGFPRTCPNQEFRNSVPTTNVGVQRLALPHSLPDGSQRGAAAWGAVSLQDGKLARGFAPMLGVNVFPVIELESPSGLRYRTEVNNFGEYVVPFIPVRENFVLRTVVETEKQERDIDVQTALVAGRTYQFDFVLTNLAPRLRVVSATAGGKPVQVATPGSTIDLHAVADDPDNDKLEYRWLLPDGSVVGPSASPDLMFAVPAQRANLIISAAVGDRRGGFAQSGLSIRADAAAAWFVGIVTDMNGQAINGAQVTVNGLLTNTNLLGNFRVNVPLADRYVMTISSPGVASPGQPGFGTESYIYKAPISGGQWRLRRAEVTTVNPALGFSLQQRRDERDCIGPRLSRVDWSPFLGANMFRWQDGRGNALALGDLGARDPRAIQNVMRLVSRFDQRLIRPLGDATHVPGVEGSGQLPCLPGIKIDIPPNALIDPSTNREPGGPVQVAMSTVALTTGDQMPGDYSALDSSNKLTAMESFGAGSIEIGAGGSRFNLKSGMTATVTIPVDATQRMGGATLAPTIPFLVYEEQAGTWKQDGEARLIGGADPAYQKTVTHLSTMNADILKSGQSCVAIELDPKAGFATPLNVEVVMQPSKPVPGVIQVRTLTVDSIRSNVIYNLPNDSDIVLSPILSGPTVKRPDGSIGEVPAGVFVVNTGGPMNATTVPPPANPDGTYYAEDSSGKPTGPCAARVTLTRLSPVALANGEEFLQGLHFQSANITEQSGNIVVVNGQNTTIDKVIEQGAKDYYDQADPRHQRNSFKKFKDANRFGQPTAATEIEVQAHYANSGDLGFGRDMHCRRNVAGDGKFDYACYVTNFGQPLAGGGDLQPDQQDANDVVDPTKLPDATVAMEYSRVENPPGPVEFPDDARAVKFYVYDTKNPQSDPLLKANLDGKGDRPVPQLCMVCHGGNLASEPADPTKPIGPTNPLKGAFAAGGRLSITSMGANFLPFDLHFYNFPATEPKTSAAVQAAFKSLNTEIVKDVAAANGSFGAPIVEMIDTALYPGGSADQKEDTVVAGWDPANPTSNQHRFYRDGFARACRTCHVAQPFGAPPFNTATGSAAAFENNIGRIQTLVCNEHIMPHAQRTNDIFWTSLNPSVPGLLELYGQTLPGWSPDPVNQCSQGPVQGGGKAVSVFESQIYQIMFKNCTPCHSAPGFANFDLVNPAQTYDKLLHAATHDTTIPRYVVPSNPGSSLMFNRITTNDPAKHMPQGGPDLTTVDTDTPPDGVFDATEINNWITAGAVGP